MKPKKSFCHGILCRKDERKNKCSNCGVYMCTHCSVPYKKWTFCIDCFVVQKIQEFNEKYDNCFEDKINDNMPVHEDKRKNYIEVKKEENTI